MHRISISAYWQDYFRLVCDMSLAGSDWVLSPAILITSRWPGWGGRTATSSRWTGRSSSQIRDSSQAFRNSAIFGYSRWVFFIFYFISITKRLCPSALLLLHHTFSIILIFFLIYFLDQLFVYFLKVTYIISDYLEFR